MRFGFRISETRNHRVRLFVIGRVMCDNHHIEEFGVYASWQHRLHTDAERRDLKADHLAPTLNRPLGGEIGRTEGQGDGRGDRRGVYKESRPLFSEVWKKGPGHADRA